MELTVLTVPGCPHRSVMNDRLAEALAGRTGVTVAERTITDDGEAARWGMRGSPTLLVDGVDPFADAAVPASMSCRMYPGPDGRLEGAPSVAALRRVLERADAQLGRTPSAAPGEPWADLLGRAGAGRLAPVEGGLRAVHQRVLRSFATTGRAPDADDLARAAGPHDVETVLAALHAADFLRRDQAGRIQAAYPFSAVPTPHAVGIDAGPRMFAMCAIDALGIAAMLHTGVRIASADPGTGVPISVTIPAIGQRATWDPSTAVVFAGRQASCATCDDPAAPPAAADICCGHINFFATPDSATTWAAAHPEITGRILGQADAERLGAAIFGPLLTETR